MLHWIMVFCYCGVGGGGDIARYSLSCELCDSDALLDQVILLSRCSLCEL